MISFCTCGTVPYVTVRTIMQESISGESKSLLPFDWEEIMILRPGP